MKIDIRYNCDKPMYEQIKDGIKQAIYSGQLKNNDVLPSVRQLAKDLNVSMITTKRAYTDLEYEGFTYTISGKGTFIKIDNINEIQTARQNELISEYESVTEKMKKSDVEKTILIKTIEKVYGGNNNEK